MGLRKLIDYGDRFLTQQQQAAIAENPVLLCAEPELRRHTTMKFLSLVVMRMEDLQLKITFPLGSMRLLAAGTIIFPSAAFDE